MFVYFLLCVQQAAALPMNSPRRRLVRRPPLVDSDLLRFLNTQQQRVGVDELLNGGGETSAPAADIFGGFLSLESTFDSSFAAEAAADVGTTALDDESEEEAAWIRQYERANVAMLLKGDGTEATRAVGVIVESMAVARAARRRVRRFLKERDQVWGSSSATNSGPVGEEVLAQPLLSDECTTDTVSSSCSNHDNMEQVINLLLQYGLSAKDICEILTLSPGIAFMQPRPADQSTESGGESLQETMERTFTGLLMGRSQPHELKLRKYDARKVLRNTPGLLTVRGSKSATKMVMLLTRLGVSSNSLSRDKNALPVLLSREPAAVFRLVAFLASDAVRMPMDKIGPLLRRAECQDLLNAIAPVPPLEQSEQQGSSTRTSSFTGGAVAAQVRRAVVNDIYRRMSQTAWTLRNEIGTKDLGKVISAYPSVLLLDASRQILPTAQYLMNELGIWEDDLPSVLQMYPALLRIDVEQMRNIVSYLASLGVHEDNLGSIFRSFPVLLTLDIEHDMEPVVAFLRSIGVSNIGRFVSRLPPVLGYSVEKELRPKFEFLASVTNDARFEVSKFPAFFSYPLERVIKTRFEYLRDVKRVPTPLFHLDHILCSGDKDFAVRIARDPDVTKYARFVEERRQALATGQPAQPPETPPTTQPSSSPFINNNIVTRLGATPPQFPPSAAAVTS